MLEAAENDANRAFGFCWSSGVFILWLRFLTILNIKFKNFTTICFSDPAGHHQDTHESSLAQTWERPQQFGTTS